MKGACQLVTIMARWLGRDLDYLADHLAPTLYKLTPITVQVYAPTPHRASRPSSRKTLVGVMS